jgi:hypothetical protein
MFIDDQKEGPGKFIYKKNRQVYEGEWVKGMPKCGAIRDLPPLPKENIHKFLIPPVIV